MKPQKHKPAWVFLAVAMAVLVPTLARVPTLAHGDASSSSASFIASDYQWRAAGESSNVVTIAQGQAVAFSYPSGYSEHNADFHGAQPSICTQTAGAGTGSGGTPPLPSVPTAQGWSGSCTFNTPGTYTFSCDAHPSEMTGTIHVVSASQPPVSTTPTPVTPGPGPAPTVPPSSAPVDSLSSHSLHLAASQHGTSVHGSLRVAEPRSRFTVQLLSRDTNVKLGQLTKTVAHAGLLHFAVRLSTRGRRTLRAHRRLALSVKLTLTPAGGHTLTRKLSVVLT
jgi:plastocyanin